MSLTALYEKIATLPPTALPKVECLVDALATTDDCLDDEWDDEYDINADPDWGPPPLDENGKPVHPQPGCMKGVFVMHDNFFEPDDVWEEYM